MLPFVFGFMALFQTETRGQITTSLGPHSPHSSHKNHLPHGAPAASTSVATARTPDQAVWCAAPQPQPALVIYNRLAKCGSSTVLSLLLRASRLSGYSFKSGDVMHELLNEREQGKLVVQLMNVSATRRVLFEQHTPYLSFPSVAAFAALGELTEPTYIQIVREPIARWVSMHYFVLGCFCDTKGGTRPPAPGQFWCAPRTALYAQYDQQAMCSARSFVERLCPECRVGIFLGGLSPPLSGRPLAAL